MSHVDLDALQALLGPRARPCRTSAGEYGTSLPPLIDHHVHLHLVDDPRRLSENGIAAALDLGGDPTVLARRPAGAIPRVRYAGAFLTAPGGYPTGRSWAPAAIVREIRSASLAPGVAGGARTAVDEQADAGASVIKISLHAAAGPIPDAETVGAIVTAARDRGLRVVAHAQGRGMTRLALDAGIDVLAHAPSSELLAAAEIADAVAAGQIWISTLGILDGEPLERATRNVHAFASAGGRVLYGTDLGKGAQRPGVNARELAALHAAGVAGADLVASLTDPWPAIDPPSGVSTFIAGAAPSDAAGIPQWLAAARVVPTEELVHDAR